MHRLWHPLWIAPALVAAALGLALVDRDSGIPALRSLRADLVAADERMARLRARIALAEQEALALAREPFALEAAIREDLGLARPGETVVRWPRREGPVDPK